ncbi:nicotinate-nucleotide adenylyltransferase [Verrucomicrobium sp. GAS474]|uniref:nicotinate-nucleotide adenylyltransferase n=1 Tax=Verrucomicrobium sp. GAS474 TaxID=1882831 RepID=UPI00087B4E75|nr:nicotinate-nucleotide adenylyltransferase [Verrucomicrobium sp. GAS474]SDT99708.1 nicotinate-nucleotide adenylyltransferase [Verrucomicrobium sp. GAS474]
MPPSRPLRIGLYGGTFDPVHHGHLIGARDALEQASLDLLVWIPCARSPHKAGPPLTSDADRLALLERALSSLGEPRFLISQLEIARARRQPLSPSYTIDTVRAFRDAFPDAALFWLIGADQLPKLGTWKEAAALRRLVTFLLLERTDDAGGKKGKQRKLPARVAALPSPRIVTISATEIRRRVRAGLPVDHLVPRAVATSIAKRGLYR